MSDVSRPCSSKVVALPALKECRLIDFGSGKFFNFSMARSSSVQFEKETGFCDVILAKTGLGG